jgi:hypothetical protein
MLVLRYFYRFAGPFLTAVPDGDCAPSEGTRLPALHKLRTQVRFRQRVLCFYFKTFPPFLRCCTGGKGSVGCRQVARKEMRIGVIVACTSVCARILFFLSMFPTRFQGMFAVGGVKNLLDRKHIDTYTAMLTRLDAKLGAEVEAGAAVSDAGIFVAELGAGSIIGAELSRYNRPGYRNARFPSQFTIVANGYVDFLVLPKSMIINVNNQVLRNVCGCGWDSSRHLRCRTIASKKWTRLRWSSCSSGVLCYSCILALSAHGTDFQAGVKLRSPLTDGARTSCCCWAIFAAKQDQSTPRK